MTWAEFREYAALLCMALGTVAAIVAFCFLALAVLGLTLGAAAGAGLWAFKAIAGAC